MSKFVKVFNKNEVVNVENILYMHIYNNPFDGINIINVSLPDDNFKLREGSLGYDKLKAIIEGAE